MTIERLIKLFSKYNTLIFDYCKSEHKKYQSLLNELIRSGSNYQTDKTNTTIFYNLKSKSGIDRKL